MNADIRRALEVVAAIADATASTGVVPGPVGVALPIAAQLVRALATLTTDHDPATIEAHLRELRAAIPAPLTVSEAAEDAAIRTVFGEPPPLAATPDP